MTHSPLHVRPLRRRWHWLPRRLRLSLRSLRCGSVVTQTASLLLCLYSLLLVLLSAPAVASFPIIPAPHPTHAPSSPPSSSSSSSSSPSDDASSPLALHAPIPALAGCYGVYELKGRRHYMEDTHAVYAHGQLFVSRLAASSAFGEEVVRRWNASSGAATETTTAGADGPQADWILFGVFDGHGGQDASAYAATHLLQRIHHKLTAHSQAHAHEQRPHSSLPVPPAAAAASAHLSVPSPPQLLPVTHNLSSIFSSSFEDIDEAYFQHPLAHHHAHRHRGQSDGSTALVVGVERGRAARKDEEESMRVVVANAGDCRALLILDETGEGKELIKREDGWLCPCRTRTDDSESEEQEVETPCARTDSDSESETGSESSSSDDDAWDREEDDELDEKTASMREAELLHMYRHFHPVDAASAVASSASSSPALPIVASSASPSSPPVFLPLSVDHKPHLPTEHSRITALPSGFVTTSSVSRVQGVLATSRAIGDYELRPFVHCQPDVIEWKEDRRTEAAARAGRWLLLGSDGFFDVYGNEVVGRWVREMGGRRGMDVQSMAKELVLSAYRKGADDNITVMIVDLHCLRRYR